MSDTNFANFNWDASTNLLDVNFNNEFMNIFPLPPRRGNISMNFNPFLSSCVLISFLLYNPCAGLGRG